MRFISTPGYLSSWSEPLLYTVATENEQSEELRIGIYNADDDSLIGEKVLRGVSEETIDIAPLLRNRLKPSLPQTITSTGVVRYNTSCKVYLKCGDTQSPTLLLTAAKADSQRLLTLLTEQITTRTIAADECDMIGFIATLSGCFARITTYGKESSTRTISLGETGQAALVITPATLGDCDQIEVEMGYSSTIFHKLTYEVKRNLRGSRRIGWLNKWLAPEQYTFPMRKSILIKAVRRHMETVLGRGAGEVERDGELKLVSAYEPTEQLQALANIVGASDVWIVEGCTRRSIDLITDRIILSPSNTLGFIEIDIRAAKEGEEL